MSVGGKPVDNTQLETSVTVSLIHALELVFYLSAVEALHALSIAVACIQISITDATHEGTEGWQDAYIHTFNT